MPLALMPITAVFLKSRNDAAFAEIFLQIPMEGYAHLCAQYFEAKAA